MLNLLIVNMKWHKMEDDIKFVNQQAMVGSDIFQEPQIYMLTQIGIINILGPSKVFAQFMHNTNSWV